jgi:hypothetical protein
MPATPADLPSTVKQMGYNLDPSAQFPGLGSPGSPGYMERFTNLVNERNQAQYGTTDVGTINAFRQGLEDRTLSPGSKIIGPGTFLSLGTGAPAGVTLEDILAGKVPGFGASIVGGKPAPPLPQSAGFPAPSTGTNLNAYGAGAPDQYANPSASPSALNYLGLPNYANIGSNFTGGTNYSNPFAGLFGASDQTNFLSGWS